MTSESWLLIDSEVKRKCNCNVRRESPRFRELWRAEVVLETECSEQPGPERPKVSGGDFRDNSLSERRGEGLLLFPQERRVMRPGVRAGMTAQVPALLTPDSRTQLVSADTARNSQISAKS